jgi:hypothetical protein
MVTLNELLDAGDRRRGQTQDAGRIIGGYLRIGIWSIGWILAKTIALMLTVIAGCFFAIGWSAAKVVPALRWARTAFVLGWEAGRSRGTS